MGCAGLASSAFLCTGTRGARGAAMATTSPMRARGALVSLSLMACSWPDSTAEPDDAGTESALSCKDDYVYETGIASGTVDPRYGAWGVASGTTPAGSTPRIAFSPGGRAAVLTTLGTSAQITVLLRTGKPDTSFGASGTTILAVP